MSLLPLFAFLIGAAAAAVVCGLAVRSRSFSWSAERERLRQSIEEMDRQLRAVQERAEAARTEHEEIARQLSAAEATRDAASERSRDAQRERDEVRAQLEDRQRRVEALSSEVAGMKAQREALDEKLALLTDAQADLKLTFEAVAKQALEGNAASFMEMAKGAIETLQTKAGAQLQAKEQAVGTLVKPINEALTKVHERLREMDSVRTEQQGALRQQLQSVTVAQETLRKETSNLVKALRQPQVRGRWGEVQLRRVVELAGMVSRCDFVEQQGIGEGGRLRPDMIVQLPAQRCVVVDSKAPMAAFLEAMEAEDDDVREQKMGDHAGQLRTHIRALGSKAYQAQLESAPEFVVLFLPGESFYSAALTRDPDLIEFSARQNVVLATPTTLIALLRAVAYGWREERVAENAAEISRLGRELYDRLQTLVSHFDVMRKGLDRAVRGYNSAVGSLESRVLVTARRFHELGAAPEDGCASPQTVDVQTRMVATPSGDGAASRLPALSAPADVTQDGQGRLDLLSE